MAYRTNDLVYHPVKNQTSVVGWTEDSNDIVKRKVGRYSLSMTMRQSSKTKQNKIDKTNHTSLKSNNKLNFKESLFITSRRNIYV